MAEIDVGAVMDAIAAAIGAANLTKRVYPYPAEGVTVPCAVVGYPTEIIFDATMGRGSDFASFPVYFIVGKSDARTTRDAVTSIVKTMKDALDDALQGYAFLVSKADFLEVTVGAIPYLAALFTCDVTT